MAKISFIVVAYNEENTIEWCVRGILSQNDLADYEIVIVNDGSKDRTADVVRGLVKKNPNIKFHSLHPNQGRGAARATGVSAARGEYFAFIDADIVLPAHWLNTCLAYMEKYDAVGGVAVPDGDINYVYVLLGLKPKVVNPTTVVAGSNGLYRRKVFERITFDKHLHNGEDSAFNKTMIECGFNLLLIESLTVEHREDRSFLQAMKWLMETGKGATRQFRQFRDVRLADVSHFVLMIITLFAVMACLGFHTLLFMAYPVVFILLVDIVYMHRKFYFEIRHSVEFLAGIIVFWFLLTAYFIGRTIGWLVPAPLRKSTKKEVMVCFDLEGKFGMPFDEDYDVEKSVDSILGILEKKNIHGVFFTVGKLMEEKPELMRRIASKGHTVAMHGYNHEHLDQINNAEMETFGKNIKRAKEFFEKSTGEKITAFRSPFLMAPVFHTPELYDLLKGQGYEWVSNREIRYPEELLRPDRLKIRSWWGKNNFWVTPLLMALNLKLIITENIANKKGFGRINGNATWLARGAGRFGRRGLIEVPIKAPLDCDLLGLPHTTQNTSQDFIDYTIASLSGGIERPGKLYMITFHDWIIGSANRLQILDKTLETLSKKTDVTFISTLDNSNI